MRVLIFLVAAHGFAASFHNAGAPRVLAFEARDRQFVSHGPGYSLSVSTHEARLNVGGHVLRLTAKGASDGATLAAIDRMPGKANYLLGREVRASYDLYGRVRWGGIYPGIDAVFRGNQEHLEYDFEIGAYRDPRMIRVRFEGADEMRLDRDGALILRCGELEIRQPAPIAYQKIDGREARVTAEYRIGARNEVGFRIGAYDHSGRW